jgi:hypothetical protein
MEAHQPNLFREIAALGMRLRHRAARRRERFFARFESRKMGAFAAKGAKHHRR